MKQIFITLLFILFSFTLKAQDTTKVYPTLLEKKISYTKDKTYENGYVEFYDIHIKSGSPLRATITITYSDKPYYTVEEILYSDGKINYYTCRKIYNGLVESEIIISLANGYPSMLHDGKMVLDKDERDAILEKVGYSLYTINVIFSKDKE